MSLGTAVVVLLVVGWLLQLAMAHLQARSFVRAMTEMRVRGTTTAAGMGGRGWGRPRTYVALSTGTDGLVREARVLSGLTVWARPRDVPELRGRALADLVEAPGTDGRAQATAMAARTLLDAAAKNQPGGGTPTTAREGNVRTADSGT